MSLFLLFNLRNLLYLICRFPVALITTVNFFEITVFQHGSAKALRTKLFLPFPAISRKKGRKIWSQFGTKFCVKILKQITNMVNKRFYKRQPKLHWRIIF